MTRAGNVPLPRFALTSPDVVDAALGQFAGAVPDGPTDLTQWVLDQPLRVGDVAFPSRVPDAEGLSGLTLATVAEVVTDPWDPTGDAVVERARRARARGADGFRVVGPAGATCRTDAAGPGRADTDRGRRHRRRRWSSGAA